MWFGFSIEKSSKLSNIVLNCSKIVFGLKTEKTSQIYLKFLMLLSTESGNCSKKIQLIYRGLKYLLKVWYIILFYPDVVEFSISSLFFILWWKHCPKSTNNITKMNGSITKLTKYTIKNYDAKFKISVLEY